MARDTSLHKQAWGMLIGLTVQYILGMQASLFVKFPDSGTQGQYWEFAWHHVPVALHIALGIILSINTIVLVVRAVMGKSVVWIAPVWLGLVGVFLAAFSGSQFITTQLNSYSLVMSLGFLLAFFAYGWGLYRSRGKL